MLCFKIWNAYLLNGILGTNRCCVIYFEIIFLVSLRILRIHVCCVVISIIKSHFEFLNIHICNIFKNQLWYLRQTYIQWVNSGFHMFLILYKWDRPGRQVPDHHRVWWVCYSDKGRSRVNTDHGIFISILWVHPSPNVIHLYAVVKKYSI